MVDRQGWSLRRRKDPRLQIEIKLRVALSLVLTHHELPFALLHEALRRKAQQSIFAPIADSESYLAP